MPFLFYDWTMILLIPGMIVSLIAQMRVQSSYAKYSKVRAAGGITATEMAQQLLYNEGIYDVKVEHVSGNLTDHYDPSNKVLRLSDGVANSNSLAALGIAAHEAGHAMQKLTGYAPLALRSAVVPVVNIGSSLSTPLFFVGLFMAWQPLVYLGIALFSLSTLFALITLPVEFDASRRAVQMLTEGGYVTGEEEQGVRKVLRAAALTYVAAAVTSLLTLLRLILIADRRRR